MMMLTRLLACPPVPCGHQQAAGAAWTPRGGAEEDGDDHVSLLLDVDESVGQVRGPSRPGCYTIFQWVVRRREHRGIGQGGPPVCEAHFALLTPCV